METWPFQNLENFRNMQFPLCRSADGLYNGGAVPRCECTVAIRRADSSQLHRLFWPLILYQFLQSVVLIQITVELMLLVLCCVSFWTVQLFHRNQKINYCSQTCLAVPELVVSALLFFSVRVYTQAAVLDLYCLHYFFCRIREKRQKCMISKTDQSQTQKSRNYARSKNFELFLRNVHSGLS